MTEVIGLAWFILGVIGFVNKQPIVEIAACFIAGHGFFIWAQLWSIKREYRRIAEALGGKDGRVSESNRVSKNEGRGSVRSDEHSDDTSGECKSD